MNFTGIEKIIHGVEDLAECMRFYDDWGLAKSSFIMNSALYKSMVGAEILLCYLNVPIFPPAIDIVSLKKRFKFKA